MSKTPVAIVSTLFYHKEELATGFLHSLMPQLVHAAHHARVKLVVTLNYPFTAELWAGLEQWAAPFRADGVEFVLIRRGYNIGFGSGHAAVFKQFATDVFVALNNDLFCQREDWLSEMIRLLGPGGSSDLVGAAENQSWLRPTDGIGVLTDDPDSSDFMDGSILGFRSATCRRLGLFSPDFIYFCYEDSDLVLRFRQAGARLTALPIPHRHLRSASSLLVPRYVTRHILDLNRATFFKRWSGYLETRRLHARIRADLTALTAEECIMALPAVIALRLTHPGANLELALPPAAPHPLFALPGVGFAITPAAPADRVWQATPTAPGDGLPPVLHHLRAVAAAYPTQAVQDHLQSLLPPATPQPARPGPQVLIVVPSAPEKFAGLAPPSNFFAPAAAALRQQGYHIVWLADHPVEIPAGLTDTLVTPGDLPGEIALLNDADLVIAPAGTAAALAQMLGRKLMIICGSVLPDRVIWQWASSAAYVAPDLACLGCHHAWGTRHRAFCLRGDEACVDAGLGPQFATALAGFITQGTPAWQIAALTAAQRLQQLARQEAPDLDLSRWSED